MSASGETVGVARRVTAAVSGSAPVTVFRLGAPLLVAHDACTFGARLRGLHGLLPLGPTEALIIRPCCAVQTWRMPCPIDVAFLDGQGAVLCVDTLAPGRVKARPGARLVVEMAAGTAERLSLAPGHVLSSSAGPWA